MEQRAVQEHEAESHAEHREEGPSHVGISSVNSEATLGFRGLGFGVWGLGFRV